MCVACNQGCISRILEQRDLRCTVNPEVGREQGFGKLAGGDGRKLVVIGGGPAGMAAARWGALAGFSVELLEADEELGGQLRAAAAAPFREEWMELRAWLLDELERLAVVVRTGIRANVNDVAKLRPWAIVVATGAEPVRPEVPQRGTLRVVPSRDLLEGKVAHHGRVVVAGGNCNGAQTSEFLAARGHRVTLIDPGADFASDAPIDERHLLLQRLEERGVEMFANARLVSIRPDHVVVSTPRGFVEIAADMLVTCLGARPVDGLVPGLREMCSRVKVVGDAREPRKITDAVAEGAGAVLELLDAERSRVAA
jgi:NADPH-dependent 2,4-dienoyl-CoA reductase/sulfur reductase-like enzyme